MLLLLFSWMIVFHSQYSPKELYRCHCYHERLHGSVCFISILIGRFKKSTVCLNSCQGDLEFSCDLTVGCVSPRCDLPTMSPPIPTEDVVLIMQKATWEVCGIFHSLTLLLL
jgi:hypothetical protein